MEACNFIKKETLAQVFSSEFCEISKNTFSTEHLGRTILVVILGIMVTIQRTMAEIYFQAKTCL